MFTSGLKESQWTEEDGRTVQVDFYEDDDIDDIYIMMKCLFVCL